MIDLRRTAAALATAGVLALEVGAVVGLGALGTRRDFAVPLTHLDDWIRATPPADALAAVLRWVAVLGAWWLLGGTLLYVAAAVSRVPGAVRAARWVALPPVRRVVDVACAATVVAGAVFAPATGAGAAVAGAPSTTEVRDGRTGGLASLPPAPAPAPAAAPVAIPAPAAQPPAAAVVVVAPDDNLWELTARRIAATTGRARDDVTDAEIAPTWVTLCNLNRATLRSGDPDLVFPGEVVVFPPVS